MTELLREKERIKQRIVESTLEARARNLAAIARLGDTCSLEEYRSLAREGAEGLIWTDALQAALDAHQIVVIPPSEEIWWLDGTVSIPSDRRIEAYGAVVRMVPEYPYVMLCNRHVHDGTRAPIDPCDRDRNISICGGTWDEGATRRSVRRFHGDPDSFCGVQTCMLFNNLECLTMTDVTFANATSFCVQVGDLTDGVFENFFFRSCFADGLHINGNCENLYIRNFSGHVGDDLVALNMYDWLGSSINYGPARNVFCEEIHSAPDSHAKAMRLQPGIFRYADGSTVDCSLTDMYFRHLSGIYEYKLYFQSPPYSPGEKPEGEGAGSADNLFFEDVRILSNRERYPLNHPETGYFGMFFLNSHIGYLSLEDIDYTEGETHNPQNYLIAVGPMSWRRIKWGRDVETFDPYVSGEVAVLDLKRVCVNGERVSDADRLVKVIEFNDINQDGFSSGKGRVDCIFIDGRRVK